MVRHRERRRLTKPRALGAQRAKRPWVGARPLLDMNEAALLMLLLPTELLDTELAERVSEIMKASVQNEISSTNANQG